MLHGDRHGLALTHEDSVSDFASGANRSLADASTNADNCPALSTVIFDFVVDDPALLAARRIVSHVP